MIIKIPEKLRSIDDLSLFENISYSYDHFSDYKEVCRVLKDSKLLYIITVIIDSLDPPLYRNKKYAKKIEIPIASKYIELLYNHFFMEFGRKEGNEYYAKLLDKYRTVWEKENRKKEIDDYIIANELEPRYRAKILKRFKNFAKLKQTRAEIKRERYYNLPEPLNHVDWRNPYDNIFVWGKDRQRYCVRGGSGSSGQRERNSEFIYGFSMINQVRRILSHLYVYTDKNELAFIASFGSLTVPAYDIGSNYYLSILESKEVLKKTHFFEWDGFDKVKIIRIKQ